MKYTEEAIQKCTRAVPATGRRGQDVLLENGLVVNLSFNSAGEVVAIFPKNGPGVLFWSDLRRLFLP